MTQHLEMEPQIRRRFILDPARWDGIHVVKPCVYLKKGGNPVPPRDPLFDGPVPAAAKP